MDNKRRVPRPAYSYASGEGGGGKLVLDSALISPRPTRASDPSVSALEGVAESRVSASHSRRVYFIIHRRLYIARRSPPTQSARILSASFGRHRELLIHARCSYLDKPLEPRLIIVYTYITEFRRHLDHFQLKRTLRKKSGCIN